MLLPPEFIESLNLSIGFVVVMVTLAFLWLSVELIGLIFKSTQSAPKATPSSASAKKSSSMSESMSEDEEGEDPRVIAAIAAAVATIIQQPHQIVGIQSVSNVRPGYLSAWSAEGRRQIHSSKTYRR